MYPFTYHKPATVKDAAHLLRSETQAKPLAGGQTLLPSLKLRLADPQALIDLDAIPDLVGIARHGDVLEIGAMTRHATVAASDEARKSIPALADMAERIGDRAVRSRGTIGGSVANNDPSADYPAACLALDAVIVTNERSIPTDEFFRGLFETALDTGEIVKSVRFRIPDSSSWVKFRNPASRFALVGVFVAIFGSTVRLAVTGASQSGVFRWIQAEEGLTKNLSADVLKDTDFGEIEFLEDLHADADYRSSLVRVMSERAVSAVQHAGGGKR